MDYSVDDDVGLMSILNEFLFVYTWNVAFEFPGKFCA